MAILDLFRMKCKKNILGQVNELQTSWGQVPIVRLLLNLPLISPRG
jgi:hypothetical protein